jgi:hypothetical protein
VNFFCASKASSAAATQAVFDACVADAAELAAAQIAWRDEAAKIR